MKKPYAQELTELPETFQWACTTPAEALTNAFAESLNHPLRAVGSGGSLTVAHCLAALHTRASDRMATVVTPLEVLQETRQPGTATWLLSAMGRNPDILAAADVTRNNRSAPFTVLCASEQIPLARIGHDAPKGRTIVHEPPCGRDGFLATNSLLAFATLLARACETALGSTETWKEGSGQLARLLQPGSPTLAHWEDLTAKLWTRATTVVLHGPSTRVGAIDLESKFTEAGLSNIQVADYRNFAHGRHNWLARHPETSSVLAITTPAEERLGVQTLSLLPASIPAARIHLNQDPTSAMLASIVLALHATGWAAPLHGTDAGQPGVARFGRDLYNLDIRAQDATDAARTA